MKKALILSMGLALSINAIADPNLQSTEQKASYALGLDLAKDFKKQGLEIDPKAFSMGMQDSLTGSVRLSDDEMKKALTEVQKQIIAKQQQARLALAKTNEEEGKKYLAANAKKSGVKTLKSGIQYKVITAGKGNSPSEDDTIFAHYEGKLIDGTVFDSSYKRGTPLKFEMGGVIPGWGEVLKLMKPGDKWEVSIPSKLAYGERGAGNRIGPNKTLIFTIELIQFSKAE